MVLGRQPRLVGAIVLTVIFFLLEIIVGELTGSIALVADSFHMLSDLAALIISLQAVRLAKRKGPNKTNTYGWQRAEQVGALVNGVFLIALVFTIFIEAIQRFATPVDVSNPELVLIVGGVGLVFNLFSMFVFGHAGHSHSHDGGHGHAKSKDGEETAAEPVHAETAAPAANAADAEPTPAPVAASGGGHGHSHGSSKMGGANMRAIFLHAFGDALGNLGVIVSALIIWFVPYSWRFYFDPIISILICGIILYSSIPLVRRTSLVLLQGIPESVDLQALFDGLTRIPGVVDVHELHVWQLNEDKTVASVHLTFEHAEDYVSNAAAIKDLFHKYRIHSTAVQPEFVALSTDNGLLSKLNPFSPMHVGYNSVPTTDGEPSTVENNENAVVVDIVAIARPATVCKLACAEDCDEPRCCEPPRPSKEQAAAVRQRVPLKSGDDFKA